MPLSPGSVSKVLLQSVVAERESELQSKALRANLVYAKSLTENGIFQGASSANGSSSSKLRELLQKAKELLAKKDDEFDDDEADALRAQLEERTISSPSSAP